MVKKRVPDWLNSSLWSASPSATDDDCRRYDSKLSTPTPPSPPLPVPPPVVVVVQEQSSKSEPKESVDDVHDASFDSSAEDISRQAQFLAEVRDFIPISTGIWIFFLIF